MTPFICPRCADMLEVPSWLDVIGYAVHCAAKDDGGRHANGYGHTIEFSLEGYQTAELERLERMR